MGSFKKQDSPRVVEIVKRDSLVQSFKTRRRSVQKIKINTETNSSKQRKIYFTYNFEKIGEIDTKRQVFVAEVVIVARWYDETLKTLINKGQDNFSGNLWNPMLKVLNLEHVLDGVNEETYSICYGQIEKRYPTDYYVEYVFHVKGTFFEKMELWDFPRDVQDLSISVSSERKHEEVELCEDMEFISTINREMIQDVVNWYLYNHVEITNCIPDPKRNISFSQPIISATCRAARNPMFYYFNNYFIMMCLVFLALIAFSIEPKDIKYRIATLLTLLLTAVAFKLSTSGQLPVISYFTMLDIYITICMVFLCSFTVHLSIISIWKYDKDIAKLLDRISLIVTSAILLVVHVFYTIIFFLKTNIRYAKMKSLDMKYNKNREIRSEQMLTYLHPTTDHKDIGIVFKLY